MATTQLKAVRDAVATVLSDAGHTVFKYGADPDHTGRTFTVIGQVTSEQTPLAFGDVRQEDIEVELVTYHKEGGRSDTAAAAGETTLLAAVAAIESDLRGDITVGGVVFNAEPSTRLEVETMADEDGWVFLARQTVDVEVHL